MVLCSTRWRYAQALPVVSTLLPWNLTHVAMAVSENIKYQPHTLFLLQPLFAVWSSVLDAQDPCMSISTDSGILIPEKIIKP